MNKACCTNAAEKYSQIFDREQRRLKKETKRDLHRMAVEENRTSLINTVLMFLHTLLLPNIEIFRRNSKHAAFMH